MEVKEVKNQVIAFSWQRIHSTRSCTVDYGHSEVVIGHLLTVLNIMNDMSSGRSCPVHTIERKSDTGHQVNQLGRAKCPEFRKGRTIPAIRIEHSIALR